MAKRERRGARPVGHLHDGGACEIDGPPGALGIDPGLRAVAKEFASRGTAKGGS